MTANTNTPCQREFFFSTKTRLEEQRHLLPYKITFKKYILMPNKNYIEPFVAGINVKYREFKIKLT